LEDAKKRWWWLEWPLRFYVAVMISVYALGKLLGGQFHTDPLTVEMAQKTVGELSGFDLAWRFFGYSEAYIWLIDLSQLLGAGLLLFARTRLVGIIILMPIMLNIILVDLAFGIPAAATFNAIHYSIILLLLLWFDRRRLMETALSILQPIDSQASLSWRWQIALAIIGFSLLFGISYLFQNAIYH
jgi:hypothetical protein